MLQSFRLHSGSFAPFGKKKTRNKNLIRFRREGKRKNSDSS